MEAVGSPSKKRKTSGLGPLEAANPAAADAEERGPEPAAEDQDPPLPGADAGGEDQELPLPGADEGGDDQEPPLPGADAGARVQEPPLPGEDRISQLPDDVLQEIISLLPTREGARTTLLASGWRHLWRSAPLNLDHHRLCQDPKDLDAAVSDILSVHAGPCRRFCPPVDHHYGARADAWFLSPALRNLQELELYRFQPDSAFRFSETLVAATFGSCPFPDITAQAIHFPKLKKLVLEQVSISESSLHTMIAGCLALECLLIANNDGAFRCVRINSITLRSICMKNYNGKLVIQNAPCLERLLQLDSFESHTSVISAAPKLETLGCLSGKYNTSFALGSTVIQRLRVDTLAPEVHRVKILSVDMHLLCLDTIINLMTCFPCLERLYIQCAGQGEKNLWRVRHKVLLKSFNIRLKKISWRYYRGTKSNVSFATFFVEKARVLELMTFQVYRELYNEESFAQQRNVLQLHKASPGARFRFTRDDCYVTDFLVHDFDLADPFERKDPYECHYL